MNFKILLAAPLFICLKQSNASIINLGTDPSSPIIDVGIDLGNSGTDQGWDDHTFDTGSGNGSGNSGTIVQNPPVVTNPVPPVTIPNIPTTPSTNKP